MALAENIKYQEEIKDLKEKVEKYKAVNNRLTYMNRELRSNKNGLLKIIKHLEKEIKDVQFIDDKVNLVREYNLLLYTYNEIDNKSYLERREMYYVRCD